MITRNYTILATEGIHARPATVLVKLARKYQSTIFLKKGERQVQLNSLLNVLSMGVKGGEAITAVFDGTDEGDAAAALDVFFREGLKDW